MGVPVLLVVLIQQLQTSISGQNHCMGKDGERKHGGLWEKVGEVRIRWEEKEKDCVGRERVGGKGGWERKRGLEVGGKERKKEDAQTNASLGNRCNQLSQSAND